MYFISGLLRMSTERNFTNIGQTHEVSGQNIQHFMSNSPWSAQSPLVQVRQEIAAVPKFQQGSMLVLDESADKKAGAETAGAGQQYNGRQHTVTMSQVGTFLAYTNDGTWTWVDGELYIPEKWFTPAMAEKRASVGIPEDRIFATKVELGWQMIQRMVAEGLPFEAVCCDTLYGRSAWLRRTLNAAGLLYMAEIPTTERVYLDRPAMGVPEPKSTGRHSTKPRVLCKADGMKVRQLLARYIDEFERVHVRSTERGELNDEFFARRVWTQYKQEEPQAEWLVIRRESTGKCTFALSNAAEDVSLQRLAWLKCQRYFIERTNQEAKSEFGFDELRAQKYQAWEHQLALTVLTSWFIAETKLDWAQRYERNPALHEYFEMEVLPKLSTANVRELLRAVLPLPQLSPEEATERVVEHLINRSRSRKSRLNKQSRDGPESKK